MIKNFMIIHKSGLPLYCRNRSEDGSENLVGGFLSAFQAFAHNLGKSSIDKIDLRESSFYYADKEPIISVVVADVAEELECRMFQIIAERLGRVFVEKFGQDNIETWNGDLELFKTFDEEYNTITADIFEMLKLSHRDFISKYFVQAARDENIVGTIVFDLKKDEIVASDIPDDFSEKDFESFSSMLFAFVNRLGNTLKVGAINELLLRAKNYWIGGFRKGDLGVFMIFKQDYFGKILPDIVTTAIE